MNESNLDDMTGLTGAKAFVLDQLSLNGDAEIKELSPGVFKPKGGYYRLLKLTTAKKGEKPDEVPLGEKVQVVFLKIRRVLQNRSTDGKLAHWTSEHNTPDDTVELKSQTSDKVMVGSARSLRERFPVLRTVQFVYGLLLSDTHAPELVKMKFKGSALGSQVKEKDVPTFYDYIYAERKNDAGEKRHLRHIVTELGAMKEEGKKTYFTVTFKDAGDLSPELCKLADEKLREVHDRLMAQDKARDARIEALRAKGAEGLPVDDAQGGEDVIQADEAGADDGALGDIPF